jgi:AhpD family alkylhydroperoxidase
MSTTTATAAVPRPSVSHDWPAGYRAMIEFDRAVSAGGALDGRLYDLIKLRASQVNGCAYCLDMHAKDLRAAGEDQQRLDVLSAWREVPLFSERERAALALTEAITLVADTRVPDDAIAAAREHFGPEELAQLVMAIVVINAWNRIAITGRAALPPSEAALAARRTG